MNANKAIGAGFGGAVTTIVVWLLNTYAHANIPDYVQGSILTIVSTALVYFVPATKGE